MQWSQITKNSYVSLASGAAIRVLLSDSWEGAAVGAIANLGIVETQQASTHAKVTALFAAARLGCTLLNAPKEWVPLVGLALNATTDNATRLKVALTTACMFLHTNVYVNDLFYSIFCGKIVTEVGRLWAHSPRALYNEANFLFLPIGILCKQTWLFSSLLIKNVWQYQSAILAMYCEFRELQQCFALPSRVVESLSLLGRGHQRDAMKLIFLSLSKFLFLNFLSTTLINRAFDSNLPLMLRAGLLVGTASYATYAHYPRLNEMPSSRSEEPTASEAQIEQLQRHIAQLKTSTDPNAKKWLAAATARLENHTRNRSD